MPNIPITSVADLYSIGTDPAFPDNGVYDLAGSLNLGGTPRSPLPTFYGAFYGHGNKITGLNVSATGSDRCGLFSLISNGLYSPPDVGVRDLEVHGTATGDTGNTGLLAGGISGATHLNCWLHNVKCVGEVNSSGGRVGGLVGSIGTNMPTTRCSFHGIVSSSGSTAGGLAGGLNSLITECYADAVVTGSYEVGGLIGYGLQGSQVRRCFSRGTVTATTTGQAMLGGLMGRTLRSCFDSYSVADVVASNNGSYVGGLMGRRDQGYTVARNFAGGQVSGSGTYTAGFIGRDVNSSIATYIANFWDTEATGKANAGLGVTATGLTTAEAEKFSTYFDAGWDIVAIPVSSP